jgi:hypothetical protein
MACAAIDDPDLIEAYLLGDLDEPARETFETHLFVCDRCLDQLRLLESMQTELRKDPQAAVAAPARALARPWWLWTAAAAAMVIVVGGAVLLRTPATGTRPAAPPVVASAPAAVSPAILALARFDPPKYVTLDLRSPETSSAFAAAMRAYAAGDYAGAAAGLQRIARSGSADVEVDFFLGVSLLMSSDDAAVAGAIDPLRRVVSRGDSPYRQLASLYLGKALVRRGDLDGADAEWARTRTLPGTHARDAQDLQDALRAARGR